MPKCNFIKVALKEILPSEFDPDVNFYENISSLDTDYFSA